MFIDFLNQRKKLKAVNSERAINMLLKTLNQYDDTTKQQMIENSLVNSWKGLFPVKENKKKESLDEIFKQLREEHNDTRRSWNFS